MECGDGKINQWQKKKKPFRPIYFFSFTVQESVLNSFSHMLSFYVLIVPQQDFLMLSSEKNIVKHPQDQEIVSYMWPIFDISAFFLDTFSLFIF